MNQISLESLGKEVERLKSIVYNLQVAQEDEYMTAEEEIELKEALKNLELGNVYTMEDVNRERVLNGLRTI